jgi:hypothetical protein
MQAHDTLQHSAILSGIIRPMLLSLSGEDRDVFGWTLGGASRWHEGTMAGTQKGATGRTDLH